MNSLEKVISVIYQRHSRKKEKREEKKKVKLEKQKRAEKIYQAISDFIKKENFDIRQHKSGYREYELNFGKTKIVVRMKDCGELRFDYQATVKTNSVWIDAPKSLRRKLGIEINKLIEKREEEEKERIIEEAVKSVEKDS